MMQPHDDRDRMFHEFLREAGPEASQPELAEDARARLLTTLENTRARSPLITGSPSPRRLKWAAVCGGAIAALLVVACSLLWIRLGRVNDMLASAHWETQEALQLFMKARAAQPTIPAPENLEQVSASDLLVIAFHHDLCPLSRVCTPKFNQMAERHQGDPARFIKFDVTGARRGPVAKQIAEMGIEFALFGQPGTETGVVKVVDLNHGRLLCSAQGLQGIEHAEQVLSRVLNVDTRP